MAHTLRRLLTAGLLLSTIGCAGTRYQWPNWLHPGNTATQRTNAVYTDPYPLDDVAPPIVGGRPLGYQRPVPEVIRGRLFTPPPGQCVEPVQPVPLPPAY